MHYHLSSRDIISPLTDVQLQQRACEHVCLRACHDYIRPIATTCNTRPAGRVRPATRFCPAREIFLSYNGNRPAASHRPPLHYTINYGIESLGCLPLHRLKTNVINNVRFVRQRSLERMMDCVYWIAIHIWRSFVHFVIRREMVVARSGGFSEIVVARSGGISEICSGAIWRISRRLANMSVFRP